MQEILKKSKYCNICKYNYPISFKTIVAFLQEICLTLNLRLTHLKPSTKSC